MGNEMETAKEFALEFTMRISTEIEHFIIQGLAQEIKYRDDAVRRECAERAIEFIRTLTSEDLDLWGDREDEGLRRAITGQGADHDAD
jgi:hypothetical protein